MPQPRDVIGQLVGPAQRLGAQRVLVVQVGRADLGERRAVAADDRVAKARQEVV